MAVDSVINEENQYTIYMEESLTPIQSYRLVYKDASYVSSQVCCST